MHHVCVHVQKYKCRNYYIFLHCSITVMTVTLFTVTQVIAKYLFMTLKKNAYVCVCVCMCVYVYMSVHGQFKI